MDTPDDTAMPPSQKTRRPTTYILDIDGTLLRHHEDGSCTQWDPERAVLLDGWREWFDDREKESAVTVLITSRPETLRDETEVVLRLLGLFWHALVMGVTSGDRVLVNDKKPGGEYRTCAVELPRTAGPEKL